LKPNDEFCEILGFLWLKRTSLLSNCGRKIHIFHLFEMIGGNQMVLFCGFGDTFYYW